MEITGFKFYDPDGKEKDCIKILKEHGINSVRFRVWVNPNDDPRTGHNSIEEVAVMARRTQAEGLKLMIDFHYSDSWADPGKQNKPAAWNDHTPEQLAEDVYQHTFDSLTYLKNEGIDVDWVQVGNEISYGMLWPDAHIDQFDHLAHILNRGYDAVKEVYPVAEVIIHLDTGNDSERFIRFFDQFTARNGKYDTIGMSYYPYWINTTFTENIDDLEANIKDMIVRYDKDILITEIGGVDSEPDITYDMIVNVIDRLRAIPDNRAYGVFYWEPQGAEIWSHYKLSAWGLMAGRHVR